MEGSTNKEERTWALLTHLSALSGHIIPFGNIIGPLIFWILRKDQWPFVDDQGKEAVNFQISITIYLIVAAALTVVLIGFIIFPIVWLLAVVAVVVAAIRANEGVAFRYPITIRFIK